MSLAPTVLVCVSGFRDTALLRGCVRSANALGWPVLYADGAYRTFLDRPDSDPWVTSSDELREATEGSDVAFMPALQKQPWPDEPTKLNAILNHVSAHYDIFYRPTWLVFLDCDERLEWVNPREEVTGFLYALLSMPEIKWATIKTYQPKSGVISSVARFFKFDEHIRENLAFSSIPPFPLLWDGAALCAPCESSYTGLRTNCVNIPYSLLRIRHECGRQTAERKAQLARYRAIIRV